MKKPASTARNAVTHGIFVTAYNTAPLSPFTQLAKGVLGDHLGDEIAADLARAEGRNFRCQAATQHQSESVEACLTNMQFISSAGIQQLDEELRSLNRLLKYQSDSLIKVRKHRIEILNAGEGIELSRRVRDA